jgi:hypothetical protein
MSRLSDWLVLAGIVAAAALVLLVAFKPWWPAWA